MKGLSILFPLLFISVMAMGQNSYDAGLIPKPLLSYASAVVRNEEITYQVNDLDNVTYHVKRVVTVLNKNGDDEADLFVPYDKITTVKYIKGHIYNEFGKEIQKISERDFEDLATSDGFSLFQDDRVKHYTRAVTDYPYTIEFEYEVKTKQSFVFNDWEPNPGTDVAVEKSMLTFICKPDFGLRYKQINLPATVATGTGKDGMKTYTWQVSDIKARRYEPMSPDWEDLGGRLVLAPDKFRYKDFSGSFTNWQQYGKWIYDNLIANREALPDQTVQYIKQLTDSIADPKLKAKKIYEYMQQKTHYISVQVGIGGYQPFLASDVDKDGYGDCKALVNYTKALLKVAGIDSYYCLVYGDRREKLSLLPDFASVQGNHVILCIPFKNDTTWLECTDQKIPFGYLSDFTDDRLALACTPEGGKLMHTPKYTTEDNLEKRSADFTITDTGDLEGSMRTAFSGADYDDRYRIIQDAPADRVKDIRKYYPINNMNISSLEYKQDKSAQPKTFENIKLTAQEYGALDNDKFYFSLNSVDRVDAVPPRVFNRLNPVSITRGYTDEDEITYTLPKGYKLGSEPLHINIDKPYGSYSVSMLLNGDQLIYRRKFQIKDGTYSKDLYDGLVDFFQAVSDADNYNVMLVKK